MCKYMVPITLPAFACIVKRCFFSQYCQTESTSLSLCLFVPVISLIISRETKWLKLFVLSGLLLCQANASAGALGNSLNPSATHTTQIKDPDGISNLKQSPSRTPSGLIYKSPYLPETGGKKNASWLYRGSVDFGYLNNDGDEKAAEFNDYKDWNKGPLINFFDFSAWHKEQGYFLDTYGGGVGRDDQYYQLSAGKYAAFNAFKVNGTFSQTPHAFSRNALTIFDGAGTENLTLPLALEPGNNSNEKIQQALQFAYKPVLGINRKQAAIGVEYTPWFGVKLFADFKHRKRHGSRPFGGSFFPPFYTGGNAGGVVETIEPIDYTNNEISSGISYVDDSLQLNLKYNGSFFVNNTSQLTFENPFINLPGTDFAVERGRIDLYPDNEYHQIVADFAYQLPLQGHLTTTFSWSRMLQDDALIAATVNSGLNFTGIDLDQWNSVNALSRETADAEIDNLLLQISGQLLPLDILKIRSKFRYQNEDNKTSYTAFNPLTQQIGYISEDGAAGGAVFQPGIAQSPIHHRSIPFAKRTIQWTLNTDYRITRKTKLGLEYQYQRIKYHHRERNKTDDNRFKVYLSSRSLTWTTLRLFYEHADRDGSGYDYNPYREFYTSSLADFQPILPEGSTPHTLADLRKFDLSSRKQNLISVQANFLLADTMDLLLSSKWSHNNYDASYGLQNDETASVNLEWNYQPSPNLNSYVFYSFQHRNSGMSNINDTGFSTDPNAGGENFPLSAAWSQSTDDNNHFIGLGVHYLFDRFDIDTHYSYNWSNNGIHYQAPSNTELLNSLLDQNITRFPDVQFNQHILETNVRWHIQKNLSLRFYHRFERGKTQDWHFQNLTRLINNQLFLNATPQNYTVNLFGVFLQYRM